MGIVPRMPYGVWLKCGTAEFLITEPISLVGHVEIRDSVAALEFVRFFSLPVCEAYLRPRGMVEVMPSAKEADDSFNRVSVSRFRRFFFSPRATELARVAKEEMKTFSIERTMFAPDGRVYAVSETLRADGFYDIISRKIILNDGSKAGLFYFGHWLPPY
jgi:hypothetical protein